MDGDGEDVRKKRQTKRDCTEVVQHAEDDDDVNDNPKKLKKEKTNKKDAGESSQEKHTKAAEATTVVSQDVSSTGSNGSSFTRDPRMNSILAEAAVISRSVAAGSSSTQHHITQSRDLESALNFLVSLSERQDEPISNDASVSFRLGHAGDVSTLASWYREKSSKTTSGASSITNDSGEEQNNEKPNSPSKATETENAPTNLDQEAASSLEIWLADGLGDEDIPPSLFSLLAHVNYSKDGRSRVSKLAAVALLTLAWENARRVLRVEWLQVDGKLDGCQVVERRLWLRLAALSLITACELRLVDRSTNSLD